MKVASEIVEQLPKSVSVSSDKARNLGTQAIQSAIPREDYRTCSWGVYTGFINCQGGQVTVHAVDRYDRIINIVNLGRQMMALGKPNQLLLTVKVGNPNLDDLGYNPDTLDYSGLLVAK